LITWVVRPAATNAAFPRRKRGHPPVIAQSEANPREIAASLRSSQ
jgi:hypothetical protein